MGDQLAGTIAVLLSDCRDGRDAGDSEGGCDGIDEGGSDGEVSDGWLLGSEDGSLLGVDEGVLLGTDDGGSSDEGLLLGEDGLLLGEDSDEDGDDEGDDPLLLLDLGQQPSPSTITSHLSLSAKCLATP